MAVGIANTKLTTKETVAIFLIENAIHASIKMSCTSSAASNVNTSDTNIVTGLADNVQP